MLQNTLVRQYLLPVLFSLTLLMPIGLLAQSIPPAPSWYTLKQHQKYLLIEIRVLQLALKHHHVGVMPLTFTERFLIERNLAELGWRYDNLQSSYRQRLAFLQQLSEMLLGGGWLASDELLSQALEGLRHGDTGKADSLLADVENSQHTPSALAAMAAYERGALAKANLDQLAAYAHFTRAAVLADDNADYLSTAAVAASVVGKNQQALIWHQRALTGYQQSGQSALQIARTNHALGEIYHQQGQYRQALDYYQQAMGLGEDLVLGLRDQVRFNSALGQAYDDLGQHDKAVFHFERALAMELEQLGENHGDVVARRNTLAQAYQAYGEYDKAVSHHRQALDSGLQLWGEHHPEVVKMRNDLAVLYKSVGQYAQAVDIYQAALFSVLKLHGIEHQSVAVLRDRLAGVYLAAGQIDKAIEYYRNALLSYVLAYGPEHPKVQVAQRELSRAEAQR